MGIDAVQPYQTDQEDPSPSPSSTACSNSNEPTAVAAVAAEPVKPDEGEMKRSVNSVPADTKAKDVRKARCLLARYSIDWRTVDLATLAPLPTNRTKSGYLGAYPARGRRWQAQLLHRTLGAYSSAWEAGCAVTRALARLARVECVTDMNTAPPHLISVFGQDGVPVRSYAQGQLEPHPGGVPAGTCLPNGGPFVAHASPPLHQQMTAYPNGHGIVSDPMSPSYGAQPRTHYPVGPPSATWCRPSQPTTHFSAGPSLSSQSTHSSLLSAQQMPPGMHTAGVSLRAAQAPAGPHHREDPFPAMTDSMPIPNGTVAAAPKAYGHMSYWPSQSPYQPERVDHSHSPWQRIAGYSPQHHQTHEGCASGLQPSYRPEPSATYYQQSVAHQPMQQPMPPMGMPPQPMTSQLMPPPYAPPIAHSQAMAPPSMLQQPIPQRPMQQQQSMPLPPQFMSQPSMPPQSMPPQSMPPHSMPPHSMPPHSMPPHSMPPHSMPQESMRSPTMPQHFLPPTMQQHQPIPRE